MNLSVKVNKMWIRFWTGLTKITGWPVQKIVFRTKIYYEDASLQRRKIKGPAIIISNHTSVYDYAVFMFAFFGRTLRYQMAEILFDKKPLGTFLKMWGGIRVDRNSHNFSFINKSEEILSHGGVVGIFPESRLPRPGEEAPLPFKPSAAYLALCTDVPVIPVYTNGKYFCRDRAEIIIGTPFYAKDFCDSANDERDNIQRVSEKMRQRVIELRKVLNESREEKKKQNIR